MVSSARIRAAGFDPKGSPMLAEQFHEAARAARNSAGLDQVARLLWRAHAEGHVSDADAEAVSEALQARRAAFSRPGTPLALAMPASARRKPSQRTPDRQASLERRRRQASSGAMPPQIASLFTMGEAAALSVIAAEIRERGVCTLCIDAIAALAGVSRTTAQNALRAAERFGLILRKERRRAGQRSLTNVLAIVSREWRTWIAMRRGIGLKRVSATNTIRSDQGKTRLKTPPNQPSRPQKFATVGSG